MLEFYVQIDRAILLCFCLQALALQAVAHKYSSHQLIFMRFALAVQA